MAPVKQAPPRSCAWCGRTLDRKRYNGRLEDSGAFQRRKFCGVPCMSQDFDARPVKTNPSRTVGHYHARKLVPKGPCRNCGSPSGRDIHHLNWNQNDNRPENLARLCRGCHMRVHHWPQRSTAAATTAVSAPNQANTSSPLAAWDHPFQPMEDWEMYYEEPTCEVCIRPENDPLHSSRGPESTDPTPPKRGRKAA